MENILLMAFYVQLAVLLFGNTNAVDLLSGSLTEWKATAAAAAAPTMELKETGNGNGNQKLMLDKSVLDRVPASARGSFLLYQLAKAINPGNYPWYEQEQQVEQELLLEQTVDSSWLTAMANEFQYVPVYESFPIDLQAWLMDSYGLSITDVYQSWPFRRRSLPAASSVCNAVGQCYQLNQIVAACCPF